MAYESCPYQFYATYVLGKPPPITPGMRRGASIHAVIARHLKRPALIPGDLDPELAPLFETFARSRFNLPPVAVEQAFVLPFSEGDVTGRIDVVLPGTEGGLELVDFKSGGGRRRAEMEGHLQLPLYALAAGRRHEVPPEQLSYTYFFLGDATEVHFAFDAAAVERVEERVEGIFDAISQGRFDAAPGCDCYACRGAFGRRRGRRTSG
jgi:RecB family exonuclease